MELIEPTLKEKDCPEPHMTKSAKQVFGQSVHYQSTNIPDSALTYHSYPIQLLE